MYYPYSMRVTHFLKRKNCKVSLHFVKYVKSKEARKPRSAEGPFRTAVAGLIERQRVINGRGLAFCWREAEIE